MNYFVAGADNQTYGPVDTETLRQWAAEGRLAPNTPLTDETGAHTVPASVVLGVSAFPPATPLFVPGPGSGQPCRNCGRVSPPGTAFCAYCGAPMSPAPTASSGSAWGIGTLGCGLSFALFMACGLAFELITPVFNKLGLGAPGTVADVVIYLAVCAGVYFLAHRRSPTTARALGYGLLVGWALMLGAIAICAPMAKHL